MGLVVPRSQMWRLSLRELSVRPLIRIERGTRMPHALVDKTEGGDLVFKSRPVWLQTCNLPTLALLR